MIAGAKPLPDPADSAGRKNMEQLIELRWLAVAGQLVTILFVQFGMDVALPLWPMLAVLGTAALLNLASLLVLRRRRDFSEAELSLALMFDVLSLTLQLYLSGGATNPFISLYLLQVVLGAILLRPRSSWIIVVLTSLCFAALTTVYRPLQLPPRYAPGMFELHVAGSLLCFLLVAALLVMFTTRISGNLRARDAHLADLRQQAAEEDHIVRIGLLASGAAHELGTPLATLAVVLNDWEHLPRIAADPELMDELSEMQGEVRRCKTILNGILLSAGDARGEAPRITTVGAFLADIVADWRASHAGVALAHRNEFGDDMPMVSDPALKQVIWNVLDNAVEASARRIGFHACREQGSLVIRVVDDGPGFAPAILAGLGKPYQSSKAEPGRGLGLFLATNVLRKLGGRVAAANRASGGAEVTLSLPLATIGLGSGALGATGVTTEQARAG